MGRLEDGRPCDLWDMNRWHGFRISFLHLWRVLFLRLFDDALIDGGLILGGGL